MLTAARDRLARTLRGDAQTAFSVELTARTDDLSLEVESFGPVRFPVTPARARKLATRSSPASRRHGPGTRRIWNGSRHSGIPTLDRVGERPWWFVEDVGQTASCGL
jgi:hypothetical protein